MAIITTQCKALMDKRFENRVPSATPQWALLMPPLRGEAVLLWSSVKAKRRASALLDSPRLAQKQNSIRRRHH